MPKPADLVGNRYGRLLVVEKMDFKEDRYSTWKCCCDCGGEIIVNTKRLTRGTITDCGCVPKNQNKQGSRPADITGNRYGRLVALSRRENNSSGRTCWLCQCDCGNQCVVTTHELHAGKTKSCGCLAKEMVRNRAVDLTGKRFGKLTVVSKSNKRSKKGSVYWHCKCDCGKEIDATQDNLVFGSYKSCGCYRREIQESIKDTLTFVDDTCIQFLGYRKPRKDSLTGIRGISSSKHGKWKAVIGLQNKKYHLGTYARLEDAMTVRAEAEMILHKGFTGTYKKWTAKAEKNNSWAKENPFFFNVEKTESGFYIATPFGAEYHTIK